MSRPRCTPAPTASTCGIGSPLNYARRFAYDAAAIGPEHRDELLFVRKAAHMGGWDIMPRAITAGIWRSVWLESLPPTAIESVYYWTVSVDAGGATLGARFQFRTPAAVLDGFTVRFHGVCGDHEFTYEWPTEFIADHCYIRVDGARLWWPKGYGDPNLYTVTMELCQGGQVLAVREDRIGIRLLHVDRTDTAAAMWAPGASPNQTMRVDSPPDPASHFVIYVNHEPIMVKGANWVPLDAFHSRDAARVGPALALFDDLGCNMIRCWGGNVYEDHAFLRPLRRTGHHGLAGLFLCLRPLPANRGLPRPGAGGSPGPSSRSCATIPRWLSGAATTRSTPSTSWLSSIPSTTGSRAR